jgi:hypothetical protein
MRELITNEIHQVAGGNFIQDLKDIYQGGIDSSELTVGILSMSTGLLMGSLMPKIAPICAVGALIAYAIYDTQHVPQIV